MRIVTISMDEAMLAKVRIAWATAPLNAATLTSA
jgi:hypothetical protein